MTTEQNAGNHEAKMRPWRENPRWKSSMRSGEGPLGQSRREKFSANSGTTITTDWFDAVRRVSYRVVSPSFWNLCLPSEEPNENPITVETVQILL